MGSNNEHQFKSDRNVIFFCKYHVVGCPKYRRKVLIKGADERLKESIRQTAQEFQAAVIELEIMPEHVHFLIGVDPQFGIHRLVRYLKGRSSRLLRQEFSWLCSHLPSMWSN